MQPDRPTCPGRFSHPVDIAVFVATHALQNSAVQAQFQTGFIQHFPLIRVPRDQAVDLDCLRLADTMTTCLGLMEEYKWSRRHHV